MACRFFPRPKGGEPPDRIRLWEEKLDLRAPFAGNAATEAGTEREPLALADYISLSRHVVRPCGFQTLRNDDAHSWLGGSPDGLIDMHSMRRGAPPGRLSRLQGTHFRRICLGSSRGHWNAFCA